MQVVAAGVHDAGVAAVGVLHGGARGVDQPGIFDDRQRVEIGPQHERGAGAVFQNADDAVAADVGMHFIAGLLPEFGQSLGGLLLLRGQLGMLVEPAVHFHEPAGVFFGPLGRRFSKRGGSQQQNAQQKRQQDQGAAWEGLG